MKIQIIINLLRGWQLDGRGYWRDKEGNLIHREKAYNKIYLKKVGAYPFPFSKYIIHHIDGDKSNNKLKNLAILTQDHHRYAHNIPITYVQDNLEQEIIL